jgi:hypothetical protein
VGQKAVVPENYQALKGNLIILSFTEGEWPREEGEGLRAAFFASLPPRCVELPLTFVRAWGKQPPNVYPNAGGSKTAIRRERAARLGRRRAAGGPLPAAARCYEPKSSAKVAAIPEPDAQARDVLLDHFRRSGNVRERAAGYGYVVEPFHFSGLLAEYAVAMRASAQTNGSRALKSFDSWLASLSPASSDNGEDDDENGHGPGNDGDDSDEGSGAGSSHGDGEPGSSRSSDGSDSNQGSDSDGEDDTPSTDRPATMDYPSLESSQLRQRYNLRELNIRLQRCDVPGWYILCARIL